MGQETRQAEAHRRIKHAIANVDKRFKIMDSERAKMTTGKKTSALRNEVIEMMGSNELNDNSSTVPAIRCYGFDKKAPKEPTDQKTNPKILLNELSMEEHEAPLPKLSTQSEGNSRKASR